MPRPRQKMNPGTLFCGLTIMSSAVLAMGSLISVLEAYRGLIN